MITKIQHANHNNKNTGKSILITDKVEFRITNITRVRVML